MSSRREEPLLRVNAFEVLIGDREIGVAEVSRLTSDSGFDGPPDRDVRGFAPVVLRRALSTSTELHDWRRAIAAGKDDRRDVTIRQLSAPGGRVVNAWRLVRAWPRRWSGPAFDALSNDIAFEELELEFEDLLWVEHDQSAPGGS